MDVRNKLHKIYLGLQHEHRDLVNKLNNCKGNAGNIVFIQEQLDDTLSQLEWIRKSFLANGEKINE